MSDQTITAQEWREALEEATDNLERWIQSEWMGTKHYEPAMRRVDSLRAALSRRRALVEADTRQRVLAEVREMVQEARTLCEPDSMGGAWSGGYHTALNVVRDRLDALTADRIEQGEWQLIETAPKDGTKVLAIGALGHHVVCEWSDRADSEMNWNDGEYTYSPTHWLPLPPPPTPREEP